jgi:hypothetical protein
MARHLRPLLLVAFILGTGWNLSQLSDDIRRSQDPFDPWNIDHDSLTVRDALLLRMTSKFEIVLVAGLATVWVLISSYAKDKE